MCCLLNKIIAINISQTIMEPKRVLNRKNETTNSTNVTQIYMIYTNIIYIYIVIF
jgi:hypothetical protein